MPNNFFRYYSIVYIVYIPKQKKKHCMKIWYRQWRSDVENPSFFDDLFGSASKMGPEMDDFRIETRSFRGNLHKL